MYYPLDRYRAVNFRWPPISPAAVASKRCLLSAECGLLLLLLLLLLPPPLIERHTREEVRVTRSAPDAPDLSAAVLLLLADQLALRTGHSKNAA
jgi:hypothetical protein